MSERTFMRYALAASLGYAEVILIGIVERLL